MALNSQRAADNALAKLQEAGFNIDGEYSKQREFVEAVMSALIDEITANGLVIVSGGSSAGEYKVE